MEMYLQGFHELINKEYFNWNFPVCKDYHLRYDHERTVDQHSNEPSLMLELDLNLSAPVNIGIKMKLQLMSKFIQLF